MNSLKVSTRLMLLSGVLVFLMLVVGVLGLRGISETNATMHTIYTDRLVPMGDIGSINRLLLTNKQLITNTVLDQSAANVSNTIERVEANIAEITKLWEGYMATALTLEEAQLAKQFAEDRKRFVVEGLKPSVAALRAGNFEDLRRIAAGLDTLFLPAAAGIEALKKLQLDVGKQEYDKAGAAYDTTHAVVIGLIVFGVAFASLLGFLMARGLGAQLGAEPGTAADLANSVARGDLSVRILLREGDRSSLMARLYEMQQNLAKVVSGVRQNAEHVATASGQIAQGNDDLSSRTDTQARSLQQSAASMEELAATVRQNADNAKQANQLAVGAATVAVKGGEVVNQVVDTMKGINESSKKITDIVSVIDGIAFQTNILALNAAVEAARAGEQGRGFAVVASEVRNLAQRSAEAAKEIRELILNSVTRVEQGTALVDQAGVTMNEIVTAIKRVTDIMSEISLASSEQSAAVATVGESVMQMDEATQQNAALVEESAAAAKSLEGQAQQLVQAVAIFKIDNELSFHREMAPPVRKAAAPKRAVTSVAAHKPVVAKKPAVQEPAPKAKADAAVAVEMHPQAKTGTNDDWSTF